jgi:hypothetical protein
VAAQSPESRRYTVDVGSSGQSVVRFGDTTPSPGGWVLRWATSHTVNFAQVLAAITARSPLWYQGASLAWGDANNGSPSMTQGGMLFVPYPWVELALYDGQGVGGATMQIEGRPLPCEQATRAATTMRGSVAWSAAAGADTDVTVPKNACAYVVTRGELTASSISVEATGLNSEVFDTYSIDQNSVAPGSVTPFPWRETPWMDANSQGEIHIINDDGVNDAQGSVYFLYDLAQGR